MFNWMELLVLDSSLGGSDFRELLFRRLQVKERWDTYDDAKKIKKGMRWHFHDDITVIVIYLTKRSWLLRNNVVGCTDALEWIFSPLMLDE